MMATFLQVTMSKEEDGLWSCGTVIAWRLFCKAEPSGFSAKASACIRSNNHGGIHHILPFSNSRVTSAKSKPSWRKSVGSYWKPCFRELAWASCGVVFSGSTKFRRRSRLYPGCQFVSKTSGIPSLVGQIGCQSNAL